MYEVGESPDEEMQWRDQEYPLHIHTPNAEQLSAHAELTSNLPMVPTILIRDPLHRDVKAMPSIWRLLDEIVAEHGTRFEYGGNEYDITADVKGQLRQGKLAVLVLSDASTPRVPTADERAAAGLDP